MVPAEKFDALFEMVQAIWERQVESAAAKSPKAPNPILAQIAQLEADLSYMESGDRARIIQEKLGLGRSNYYALRKSALSSPASPKDCRTLY
jgi:hypothetical protein